MLAAFPSQPGMWMESILGRLVWVMDWARSISLCNFLYSAELLPNQVDMQLSGAEGHVPLLFSVLCLPMVSDVILILM